jgi:hypothetical protein
MVRGGPGRHTVARRRPVRVDAESTHDGARTRGGRPGQAPAGRGRSPRGAALTARAGRRPSEAVGQPASRCLPGREAARARGRDRTPERADARGGGDQRVDRWPTLRPPRHRSGAGPPSSWSTVTAPSPSPRRTASDALVRSEPEPAPTKTGTPPWTTRTASTGPTPRPLGRTARAPRRSSRTFTGLPDLPSAAGCSAPTGSGPWLR